jgi:AraC-like DNA-binding protein
MLESVLLERPSRIAGAVVWTTVSAGRARRILPDGCMDLVWDGEHLVIAGPDTAAFLSRRPPGAAAAGLRFAPGAMPLVLGVPAHTLRDQHVPLDAVWPAAEVARIEAAVAAARPPGRALESAAVRFGRAAPAADALTAELVRQARRGERVATTAEAVGLSARQLQRRSLDAFGYGPKLLARILRLDRALALARRGAPLAAVAADCGYADQAHLADDVRALAGATLSELGLGARQVASGANRSTPLPSGSRTVA